MRIAVNTRFLLSGRLEGYGYFMQETFRRIVASNPEHTFIFIFDRGYDQEFVFAKNVIPVVTGPAARHPVLWKYWYDIKLPVVLKKHKADVFVSCDGFCSLTTKIPQCLLVHDLSFLHYPAFINRSHFLFYKYYTPKFIAKAVRVATVSQFSQKDIVMQYQVESEKIDVVYSAAKEIFRPLTELEKQKTKDQYTKGREYFVYAGAIHPRKNPVNLLKAFSAFKKRQKSNWKLVLAGRLAWKYDKFRELLKTFKFRDDVVLTGYIDEEEMVRVIGSAYALVYPSIWEGFGVPVLEAMQCNIPVITSANSSMQEIAGDAALYADPADSNDLGEKMMLLYKDERLRGRLITNGIEVAKSYTWDRTAQLLWDSIKRTAG